MLDGTAPKRTFGKTHTLIELGGYGEAIVLISVIVFDQIREGLPDHAPRRVWVMRAAAECFREAFGVTKGKVKAHKQPSSRRAAGFDLRGQILLSFATGGKVEKVMRSTVIPAAHPNRVLPLDRHRSRGPVYGDQRIKLLHGQRPRK